MAISSKKRNLKNNKTLKNNKISCKTKKMRGGVKFGIPELKKTPKVPPPFNPEDIAKLPINSSIRKSMELVTKVHQKGKLREYPKHLLQKDFNPKDVSPEAMKTANNVFLTSYHNRRLNNSLLYRIRNYFKPKYPTEKMATISKKRKNQKSSSYSGVQAMINHGVYHSSKNVDHN